MTEYSVKKVKEGWIVLNSGKKIGHDPFKTQKEAERWADILTRLFGGRDD